MNNIFIAFNQNFNITLIFFTKKLQISQKAIFNALNLNYLGKNLMYW